MAAEESEFVAHEPCPECGSQDNLARYSDGHCFCFGCGHYESGEAGEAPPAPRPKDLLEGDIRPLEKRRISAETCRRFRYMVGTERGETVHIATYCDLRGVPVAQKVRTRSKNFSWKGRPKEAGLFGQHLWRGKGRRIVVTEGEIDALSYAEATDCRWPVVSLANGAQSAKKSIERHLEFLEGYEEVIFAFDMDEPGRQAATQCAELLSPGKARIAELPRKDANEVLCELGAAALSKLPFEAKAYRPDDVVVGSDLWDLVSTEPEGLHSVDYPWASLSAPTQGLRRGEIVTLCAGSGIGKSTVCREVAHHLHANGETIGYIALEESVRRTALGLMSVEIDVPIHLQFDRVSQDDLRRAFEGTLGTGRIVIYDHWGSIEGERLMSKIRSMVRTFGVGWIVLDHISIVVSGLETENERKDLDIAMTQLRTLAEELHVGIILVSHLKRVSGRKGFDCGGQVHLSDLRGSAALEQLSDMVIALERDQQDEDEANVLRLRVLKNRWSGDTGLAGNLEYDKKTGRLRSIEVSGFGDDDGFGSDGVGGGPSGASSRGSTGEDGAPDFA